MALQKQLVGLSLSAGLDTKTSPLVVAPPRLLALENASFQRPGQLTKRNGSVDYTRDILSASDVSFIGSGEASMAYRDELTLATGTTLFSRDVANSAWASKGTLRSVCVTQDDVVRNALQQADPDGNTASNGIRVFAWTDATNGLSYSVIDGNTGDTLIPPTVIDAAGIRPKVLILNSLAVILYTQVAATYVLRAAYFSIGNVAVAPTLVDLSDPTGLTDTITLNTPDGSWDATVATDTPIGPQLYVAMNTNEMSPRTRVWAYAASGALNSGGSLTTFPNPYNAAIIGAAGHPLCIFVDLNTQGPVVARTETSATTITFFCYDTQLQGVIGNGTITVGTLSGVILSITGVSRGADATNLFIAWSVNASAGNEFTQGANVIAYVGGDPATIRMSVMLIGKAVAYNGHIFAVGFYNSTIQPVAFLFDLDSGYVAAKLLYENAGGRQPLTAQGYTALAEMAADGDTAFRIALSVKTLLSVAAAGPGVTSATQFYSPTGVTSALLDFFNPTESWLRAEAGYLLNVSGGYVSMYDGLTPVELGFHVFPQASVTQTSHMSSAIAAGDYWYVVTYEWQDQLGQTHRSAPSLPVMVTISGSDQSATLTISNLRMTQKQAPRANANIVVYRTTGNPTVGALYYRVYHATSDSNAPANPLVNNPATNTTTFEDVYSDAQILPNPGCYTNGGIVENIPPNATSSLTVFNGRLWALDSTNPYTLWYTKFLQQGEPPQFSDVFTLNVDPRGGPITAIAGMDDKLIVFKADRVFQIQGRGPDATGGQQAFQDAVLINTDCGCTNPRSVVEYRDGLMLQTDKGIYLLDRAGQAQYIGAPVEAYNGQPVTSSVLVANTNQIRLTLAQTEQNPGGVRLVYDYYAQQWSTDPNIAAVDSAIFDGQYVWLRDDGTIFQETPGVYTDSGNYISRKFTTAWIQLAGLQGYQRIYSVMILGAYASAHNLKVSIAYDFNPEPTQTVTVVPLSVGTYGGDSVYGGKYPSVPTDTATYGGAFPTYMWKVGVVQQKSTAIQITVEDISDGTPAGEGSTLVGISLEYGVMTGGRRLPARQSY